MVIRDATQNQTRELVLGRGTVPTSLYTQDNITHSYDFQNLSRHCKETARKNAELPDQSKLYVLKSNSLRDNLNVTWNDQWILEKTNKLSLFKDEIEKYHISNREILSTGTLSTYFYDIKDNSRDILCALLKTVYYTGGSDGIITIQQNLSAELWLLLSVEL